MHACGHAVQFEHVAPHTGARIETRPSVSGSSSTGSPLTQGRGSKHAVLRAIGVDKLSPLTQGRGSKLGTIHPVDEVEASPLTQGRGSKHRRGPLLFYRHRVAPHTGARIETLTFGMPTRRHSGRPSHRGADRNADLKGKIFGLARRPSHRGADRNADLKAPICRSASSPLTQGRGSKPCPPAPLQAGRVAPHTGARIETPYRSSRRIEIQKSPLTQGRGSKPPRWRRGNMLRPVAPHTGARIETA